MTSNIATLTPPTPTGPGAQPELLHLTDGCVVFTWERIVSAAVWIAREDGIGTDGEVAARAWPAELVGAAEVAKIAQSA